MVLSRLTKITGPGVSTDTNWVGNNANYTGILTASSLGGIGNITATGIITATKFVGPVEGNVTAVDGTFSGNVSIAGTLTYEDVTNIDSVGIITARSGLASPYADVDDFVSVGSNIHLGNAGVITATSFVGDGSGLIGVASTDNIVTGTAATFTGGVDINSDLDVDGHTNLDNVSISGVTTITSAAPELHFTDTNANSDYSIVVNSGQFRIRDETNSANRFAVNSDGHVDIVGRLDAIGGFHASANSLIEGNLELSSTNPTLTFTDTNHNSDFHIENADGSFEIRDVTNGADRVRIASDGTTSLLSNVNISGDLDVDGHTNLDNVSIAGVVTATSFVGSGANLTNLPAAQLTGTLPAISGANLTNLDASDLASGTVPDARFPATLPAISGANLTNLDASDLASGTVPTARLGSGTANNTTFLRGDSTFQTVNTDLVSDTSPQLGGNLASNGNLIKFGDSSGASDDRLTFGNGDDIQIYYATSNLYITQATGDIILENTGSNTSNQIYLRGKANNNSIAIHGNGAVELYDQSSGSASKKFETTSGGTKVTGLMEADRTRNTPITTTQRNALSSPAEGTMIYNSTLKKLQVYTDSQWVSFSGKQINVSGGTISNNVSRAGYVVHTFTSPGTFSTSASLEGVEIMVVGGGGGGGGHRYGSGGGAGGVIMRPGSSPTPAYPLSSPAPVVVGAGGGGGANNGTASGGSNSTFGSGPMTLIGKGGGGGTSYDGPAYPGRPGGSGAGGTSRAPSTPGGSATQPGTHGAGTDYGNRGGNYTVPGGGWAPGGGGGAGANGMDTPGQQNGGGNGGAGIPLSITGSATYYGGGGAAGIYNNQSSGSNWYGIGGNGGGGSSWNSVPGSYPGHSAPGTGAANSGGGGCGAHGQGPGAQSLNNATSAGKAGGSGIVIVAYPTTQPEGEVIT